MVTEETDYFDRVQAALEQGKRLRRDDVQLLAEEVRRCRILLDADLTFRDLEMKIRDGSLDLQVVGNEAGGHPAYRLVAAMFHHLLLGEENEMPPNYRSMEWEVKPAGEFQGIRACTEVIAPGGKSSHAIRRELEAELAALKSEHSSWAEVD